MRIHEEPKLATDFVPAPILTLTQPEEIKAFTDPLRIRILGILNDRVATNQQLSDELGESHSKVLYHVRFLLDAGLIKLVETQIRGGNVEKYYRAVARVFDLRPSPGDVETDVALAKPVLDRVRSEMIASLMLFPSWVARFHTRRGSLTAERMAEFNDRLLALLAEYWDPSQDDPDAVKARLAVFAYRDPREEMEGKGEV